MLRMSIATCLVLGGATLVAAQDPAAMTVEELKAIIVRLRSENSRLEAENTRLKKAVDDNGIVLGEGYHSIVEIVKEMPAELQPLKWDSFNIKNATEWLGREPIGEPFEAIQDLVSVRVRRLPFAKDPQSEWEATISFRSREFKYQGKVFTQWVGNSGRGTVRLVGDEQFAQRMSNYRQKRVELNGKIESLRLTSGPQNRLEVRISLNDLKISLD